MKKPLVSVGNRVLIRFKQDGSWVRRHGVITNVWKNATATVFFAKTARSLTVPVTQIFNISPKSLREGK